jgi:proteasome assembly chaperone (PAC2) family protein
VIELEGVPELIDPVMVAAFEGWNDAGDAASAAVGHLEREWKGEVFAALDAEDYYDFQVNRPQVWLDGGVRKVTWPTTRLSVVRADNAGSKGGPRDLVLVRGIEPSMRWRSFCNEILGFAHELGVEMVVILGALLGDTPHSRPVPVTGVTSDPDLARTMNLEESRYEGPTGIVGILQEACTHAGVPAVSLWASVPHYVSQPPNPKASLALLNGLEDLLGLSVPLGELPEDARAWQLGVDQLAAEDSEVAEYVQSLEEARDTAELPEASGEAIAKEFERYLRRRDDGPGGGPSGTGGNARESGASSSPAVGGEAPKTFGGEAAPKRGGSGGRRRTSKPVRKDGKDSKDATDGKGGKDGKERTDKPDGKEKDRKDDKENKEGTGSKDGKGSRQRRGTKGGKSSSRSSKTGKDKTADAAGPEDGSEGGGRPEDEEPRASSDGDPGETGESSDDK